MCSVNHRALMLLSLAAALFPCLAAPALGQGTSPQAEREQARQNELRRRGEAEQAERVGRLKDRFLLQVQQSGELLGQLATAQEALAKQRSALLNSDEGKTLVCEPVSFMAFLELHQRPCVTAEEIKAKQAAAASIVNGLKAEAQQLDVGYLPSAQTQQEATELYVWARDRLSRLEGEQATLKTLLAKAPKLAEPAKVPTLSRAIEEYQARWYQVLAESKILGEQAAEKDTRQIMVNGSRLARLEQAQAESEKLLEQERAEMAQMKLTYQLQLLQAKKDAERREFEAQKVYQDAQAEIERLRKDAEAKRTVQEADATVARQKFMDDAKRREQIALLDNPAVRQVLAPFLAKGHWSPNNLQGFYQLQPMSLSSLARAGALEQKTTGLQRLLTVATTHADKQRPRWPYDSHLERLSGNERVQVTQAQQYLIQLGQLMVEQGLLAP